MESNEREYHVNILGKGFLEGRVETQGDNLAMSRAGPNKCLPITERVVKFGEITDEYAFRVFLMPERLPEGFNPQFLRKYAAHPEFWDVEYFPYVLYRSNGCRKIIQVRDYHGMFSIIGHDDLRNQDNSYKFKVSKQVYALAKSLSITEQELDDFLNKDVDGYLLFREIKATIRRYVDIEEWCATLLALWIMCTHIYTLFDSFPYILLHAEKGSGKSRVLKLAAQLTSMGQYWVSPRVAPLFRSVEALHPTLLLDELEFLNDEEQAELVNLLNAGYERGAVVPRMNKDTMMVEYFDAYCPKALATTQSLSSVLQTRCLRIPIRRTTNQEFVSKDPMVDHNVLKDIQKELVIWSIENGMEIARTDQHEIEKKYKKKFEGSPPRIFQIMRPILVLYDFLKLGEIDEAESLTKIIENQAQEAKNISVDDSDQRILATLYKCLVFGHHPLHTKDIISELGMEEDSERKFYNAHRIGLSLKKYGIESRTINGRKEYLGKSSLDDAKKVVKELCQRYNIDISDADMEKEQKEREMHDKARFNVD